MGSKLKLKQKLDRYRKFLKSKHAPLNNNNCNNIRLKALEENYKNSKYSLEDKIIIEALNNPEFKEALYYIYPHQKSQFYNRKIRQLLCLFDMYNTLDEDLNNYPKNIINLLLLKLRDIKKYVEFKSKDIEEI